MRHQSSTMQQVASSPLSPASASSCGTARPCHELWRALAALFGPMNALCLCRRSSCGGTMLEKEHDKEVVGCRECVESCVCSHAPDVGAILGAASNAFDLTAALKSHLGAIHAGAKRPPCVVVKMQFRCSAKRRGWRDGCETGGGEDTANPVTRAHLINHSIGKGSSGLWNRELSGAGPRAKT